MNSDPIQSAAVLASVEAKWAERVERAEADTKRLEWIVEYDMLDFLACHVLGWSEPTGVDGLRAAIDRQIAMKKEREQAATTPERPKQ